MKSLARVWIILVLSGFISYAASAQLVPASVQPDGPPPALRPRKTWHFAAAGDSRNCGDIIMPAIAHGAAQDQVQFYWHLGDLRWTSDFDEDMLAAAKLQHKHISIADYENRSWDDFRQNQVAPFGAIPFFVGIGNHETTYPKTRAQFENAFADLLNIPPLKEQRERDQKNGVVPDAGPKTYFHWTLDGVDFIYLDDATHDEFSPDQLQWFEAVLGADSKNESVHTVVVGMHAALPESISRGHSMNEWQQGGTTGEQVYRDLLKFRNDAHKLVYVLCSHSHYYMEDIFNTPYWRSHGGVLPGWIAGTAGAHRYTIPKNAATVAKENVYGYLVGTVNAPDSPAGSIQFEFKEIHESDIPQSVVEHYSPEFVHWCFISNSSVKPDNGAPGPPPVP